MPYSIYINGDNVSEYVTKVGEIPVNTRNDDYSLYVDDVRITIGDRYGTVYEIGDTVLIYARIDDSGDMIYNGYITSVDVTASDYKHQYTVESVISKLKDYTYDLDNMLDNILTYDANIGVCKNTGTDSINNFITINNLYKAIFAAIGITLDWTYYEEEEIGYFQAWKPVLEYISYTPWWTSGTLSGNALSFGTSTSVVYPMNISTIVFHVEQLWCINQKRIYNRYDVKGADKVSLWDLINKLNYITGYYFFAHFNDETKLYISNKRAVNSISNNTMEDYHTENKKPEAIGVKLEHIVPFRNQNDISGDGRFQRNMLLFMRFPSSATPPGAFIDPYNIYIDRFDTIYPNGYASGDYNLQATERSSDGAQFRSLEWFNHLVPYRMEWIPSEGTSYPWILTPFVYNKASLIRKLYVSNMMPKFVVDYENEPEETPYGSTENYITIGDSGRRPFSTVKTVEIDEAYTPGVGAV